jgi:hypothetical protein
MQVEFHRTGEKRYAVVVNRDGLPPLRMDPAPGFDALMPHDMLHFIVEKELGLTKGIFGQIAAGGTAGTFHLAQSSASNNRANARNRRSTKERGKKLLDEGQADCAQSERGTYICLYDWLSRTSDPKLRTRAAEMKDTAGSLLNLMPAAERKALNDKFLAQMRIELAKLSREWAALKMGQSMTLEWSLRK